MSKFLESKDSAKDFLFNKIENVEEKKLDENSMYDKSEFLDVVGNLTGADLSISVYSLGVLTAVVEDLTLDQGYYLKYFSTLAKNRLNEKKLPFYSKRGNQSVRIPLDDFMTSEHVGDALRCTTKSGLAFDIVIA